MKSFARIAVAGISGIVLYKLLATVILPVMGMMLGLLMLAVKIAAIAAIAFFLWGFLKKRIEEDEPGSGEIVVEEESGEG